MTTTASTPSAAAALVLRRSVLRGSFLAGVAVTVVAVVVAAIGWGSAAAVGSAIGGVAAVLVLGGGTALVLLAAQRMPAVSLLVGLVVFTFQGLLLAGVLGAVRALFDREHTVAARLTVIAVTLLWTTMFAVLIRKARLPIFDLPVASTDPSSDNASRGDGAGV